MDVLFFVLLVAIFVLLSFTKGMKVMPVFPFGVFLLFVPVVIFS